MAIFGITHIVKILIQACIVIAYDQLVCAPTLNQIIDSFPKITDFVCLIIWIIYECKFEFLIGGRDKNSLKLRLCDELA